MKRRPSSLIASFACLLLATALPTRAIAESLPGSEPPPIGYDEDDDEPLRATPPRLSHTGGKVSFWREGADDWTAARVNTPLAPGDQLYTGDDSNLELQIGPRDFVRVGSDSQLAFDSDEIDYQQFRLTGGQASVDLRGLRAGEVVEVDTPHGAFTIEHNGYYRFEVDEDATRFATRRGGRATVTPANGDREDVAPGEEVVVTDGDVERYAASDPDDWDHWNDGRSDGAIEAVSYRHVPDELYGVDDLDHYGRWRAVPRYGSVWFPSAVATGWAPYTAGRWIHDPYYGWTWIDDAPWGWAPFHYGRWVHVDDFWGWAPGPIVARPVYAPALVTFFSTGPISIGVSLGAPLLGWTALGWGEPCRPWWGSPRYVGRPRWFGWGGPRVHIDRTVVHNINVYQNTHVRNAVVVVDRDRFARGPVGHARVASFDRSRFREVGGALPLRADGVRVVGGAARADRPPRSLQERRVVATREPEARSNRGFFRRAAEPPNPAAEIVQSPREARAERAARRPRSSERAGAERNGPPAPRLGDRAGRDADRDAAVRIARPEASDVRARRTESRGESPRAARSRNAPQRVEASRAAPQRAERAQPERPRVAPQRSEPPRVERVRSEPPRVERSRAEPPRADARRAARRSTPSAADRASARPTASTVRQQRTARQQPAEPPRVQRAQPSRPDRVRQGRSRPPQVASPPQPRVAPAQPTQPAQRRASAAPGARTNPSASRGQPRVADGRTEPETAAAPQTGGGRGRGGR